MSVNLPLHPQHTASKYNNLPSQHPAWLWVQHYQHCVTLPLGDTDQPHRWPPWPSAMHLGSLAIWQQIHPSSVYRRQPAPWGRPAGSLPSWVCLVQPEFHQDCLVWTAYLPSVWGFQVALRQHWQFQLLPKMLEVNAERNNINIAEWPNCMITNGSVFNERFGLWGWNYGCCINNSDKSYIKFANIVQQMLVSIGLNETEV